MNQSAYDYSPSRDPHQKRDMTPLQNHGTFMRTYWIFIYAMIILVFSTVFNIKAVIPRASARYTPEYYERMVQAYHVALMAVGIGLLTWQLARPLLAKLKGRQLTRRKPKIIPRHVMIIAWILTIVTIIFLIWRIAYMAVFLIVDCDKAVKIPSKVHDGEDPAAVHRETSFHRQFIIASDFSFYLVGTVYLLLQCAFVHVWNRYKIPKDCCSRSFPINCVHLFVVNLAIYVRLTLVEAKETYDHYQHYQKYQPWLYDEEGDFFRNGEEDTSIFARNIRSSVPYASFNNSPYSIWHQNAKQLQNFIIQSIAVTPPTSTTQTTIATPTAFHSAVSAANQILADEVIIDSSQSENRQHNPYDDWRCHRNSSHLTPSLVSYWKEENNHIIEPFGFAMKIECLLTLALFVYEILHGGAPKKALMNIEQVERGEFKPERPVVNSSNTETGDFPWHKSLKKQLSDRVSKYSKQLTWDMPKSVKIASAMTGILCILVVVSSVCGAVYFFLSLHSFAKWEKTSNRESPLFSVTESAYNFFHFAGDTEIFLTAKISAGICLTSVAAIGLRYQKTKQQISTHARQDILLLMFSMASEVALGFFVLLACVFHKKAVRPEQTQRDLDDYPWDYMKGAFGTMSVVNILASIVQTMYISRSLAYKTYMNRTSWILEATGLISLILYNTCMWLVEVFSRKFTFRANFIASNFYDKPVWSIVNEVVYPISIFYRFHILVLAISLLGLQLAYLKAQKTCSFL